MHFSFCIEAFVEHACAAAHFAVVVEVWVWVGQECVAVALADDLEVDVEAIGHAVEVGEQAPVAVGLVGRVVFEPDLFAFEQAFEEEGCLFSELLDRFLRMDGFWGIDTDEADRHFLAVELDSHGITVDDAYDRRAVEAAEVAGACGNDGRGHGDLAATGQDGQEGAEQGEQGF